MQHEVTGAAHRNNPARWLKPRVRPRSKLSRICRYQHIYTRLSSSPTPIAAAIVTKILGESDLSSLFLNQSIKQSLRSCLLQIWCMKCVVKLSSLNTRACVIGVNYLDLVCSLWSNPDLFVFKKNYICCPNFVIGNEFEKFSLIVHNHVLCACV